MNISSFVNQITQTITDAANGNTGNLSPSALEESIRNGLEAILSKGSGQSVTGEVLQMNGNEILLSLGENQLLQARLDAPQQYGDGYGDDKHPVGRHDIDLVEAEAQHDME